MRKTQLVARLLPALAVSGVLIASLIASPVGQLFGAFSGFGYGACGYGTSYSGSPTVTGVSPNQGPTAGGTLVQVTGSGFCNSTTSVKFGATSASNINVMGDTLLSATSPAHAAGAVDVTVTNAAGTSPTSVADKYTYTTNPTTVYTAMAPERLLDTRSNGSKLGPGGSLDLAIGGISVPSNATSVILNVTTTNTTAAGFFTVFPAGASLPTASNLNWVAGQTIPNLVSVSLGTGGKVTIYNGHGNADVVVDLEGYFAPNTDGTAGEFAPLVPARITDTRAGSGQANAGSTLTAGATLDVQVTGAGGVPATGVTAVILNATVTNTTAAGFLTAFPTGSSLPLASNLNWTAGKTIPNRVVVPVGTGGKVSFYNGHGNADLVVDVNGYISDGSLVSGSSFASLTPSRIKDTRTGPGVIGQLGPGTFTTLTVAGNGGVPATGAKAVIVNVTVTNPTAASFLTIWPTGATMPTASDLNFVAGQTVPNLVVVKLSGGGSINIYNGFGSVDVIVDVEGWFG